MLYLHFHGFARIEGLARYTGLRALYLEGNGLAELQGGRGRGREGGRGQANGMGGG